MKTGYRLLILKKASYETKQALEELKDRELKELS
jgi:hypothetical protein